MIHIWSILDVVQQEIDTRQFARNTTPVEQKLIIIQYNDPHLAILPRSALESIQEAFYTH